MKFKRASQISVFTHTFPAGAGCQEETVTLPQTFYQLGSGHFQELLKPEMQFRKLKEMELSLNGKSLKVPSFPFLN